MAARLFFLGIGLGVMGSIIHNLGQWADVWQGFVLSLFP